MPNLNGKTVRVGAFDYRVVEVERLQNDDRSPLLGKVDVRDLTIAIDAEADDQVKQTTLWHEMMHAILVQAGLDEHDEKVLEVLCYGIVGILRDNPQLARLVQGAPKEDGRA